MKSKMDPDDKELMNQDPVRDLPMHTKEDVLSKLEFLRKLAKEYRDPMIWTQGTELVNSLRIRTDGMIEALEWVLRIR